MAAEETVGRLAVQLALQTGSFDSGMKRVGTQLQGVDSEFKASAAEAAAMGDSFDSLGEKQTMLTKKLEIQQDACGAYRQQLDKLKGNLTGAKESHAQLTQKTAEAKTEFEAAKKEMEAHTKAGDLSESQMEALANQVAQLEGEYRSLADQEKAAGKRVSGLADNITKTEKAYADMRRQTAETRQELNRTTSEIDRQKSAWGKIGKVADDAAKKFDSLAKKQDKLGNKMSMIATVPITAAFYKATDAAMDHEDALAAISTIADPTVKSLHEISNELIATSNATGIAIADLTAAEYTALSSSIETGKSTEFIGVSAKAAKAGFTDLTTAVDGSTNVLNAWGLGAEYATDVYNKMLVAQDLGKMTLGEIASSIGNVAATAAGLGVSYDEVFAASAAMTQGGISAEKSMTMLNQVFANVLKPTAKATKVAKELGLEFNATAIKTKGLAGFLADVEAKAGGNEAALAKLFGSVEAYKAVAALAGNQSDNFRICLDAMQNSTGRLDSAFEKVSNTSGEKLRRQLNQLQNGMLKLGETALPMVNGLMDSVNGLVEGFASLDEGTRKNLLFGAGAVALIGPAAKALAGVNKTISGIAGMIGKISASGGIMGALGAANPLGLAIGVTAAAVALGVLITKVSEAHGETAKFRERLENVEIGLDDASKEKFESEVGRLVQANRKIIEIETKIEGEKADIQTTLENMLSDGKFTKGENNKLRKQINGWVDDAIAGVKEDITTKNADLASALDGIGMSDEAKQGVVDYAKNQGNETIAELEGYRTELLELQKSFVGGTENITADQIARYNELLTLIGNLKAEITVANEDMLAYYEARKQYLASGNGTPEEAAANLQLGLELELDWKNSQEKLRREAVVESQKAYEITKEAFENGAEGITQEDVNIAFNAVNLAIENEDNLKAEYSSRVQEVINGAMDTAIQNVEGGENRFSEFLQKYMDLGFASSSDLQLGVNGENANIMAELINKYVDPDLALTGESVQRMSKDGKLQEYINQVISSIKESMTSELETGDFNVVQEMLKSVMDSGSLDGVDASGLSENVKALFGMVDFKESGGSVTKDIWQGLADGLSENYNIADTAMSTANDNLIDNVKTKWGVQSPSTVMKEIFKNVMEGARDGVTENASMITDPFQTMVDTDFPQLGKDMVDELISGIKEKAEDLKTTVSTAIKDAVDAGQLKANTGIKIPVSLDFADNSTKKLSQQLGL